MRDPALATAALALALLAACDHSSACPTVGCGSPTHSVQQIARSDSALPLSFIVDVELDDEGRTFVVDATSTAVLALDSTGTLLRVIGSAGSGPGEFTLPRSIRVVGTDTLFVYDSNQARASYFSTATGALLREWSVPPDYGRPYTAEPLVSGDLLLLYREPTRSDRPDRPRRLDVLRLLAPDTTLSDTIFAVRSPEFLMLRAGGRVQASYHPFGNRPLVMPASEPGFHLVQTDSLAITTVYLNGSRHHWARPLEAASPPPAEVERWVELLGESYRDVLDADSMRVPVVEYAFADAQGRVWLGVRGDSVSTNRWIAVDQGRRPSVRVDLPPGIVLWAARGDRLVGVSHDRFDVPRFEFFRLEKR